MQCVWCMIWKSKPTNVWEFYLIPLNALHVYKKQIMDKGIDQFLKISQENNSLDASQIKWLCRIIIYEETRKQWQTKGKYGRYCWKER